MTGHEYWDVAAGIELAKLFRRVFLQRPAKTCRDDSEGSCGNLTMFFVE